MPFFYQFQRVRIVNATWENGRTFPEMIGQECTLMKGEECYTGVGTGASWLTDLPHPDGIGNYCVLESMIEPVQFDFDKETEENIEEELEYAFALVKGG